MRQIGVQMGRIMLSLVSLLCLAGLPAFAADNVRQAIEAANRKFEAAVSRGDGPGTAALYTAAGQLLPAQSDLVSGTQAIGQFWQAVFDSGIKGASLTTVEVEGHGNTAHEVGKYELRGADGKVLDHGKYVVIWKKDGASWKLHRDIWTTSVVPAKQ
jgi:ketosteroid isomerase-like protein